MPPEAAMMTTLQVVLLMNMQNAESTLSLVGSGDYGYGIQYGNPLGRLQMEADRTATCGCEIVRS